MRSQGTSLFADISGFTPLTEALTRTLGARRGVEELTRHLNRVYDALVDDVHRYGGSIINFAGDAITCWFDADAGERAVACGLAMQEAMGRQPSVEIQGGAAVPLTLKVGVARGSAGRFAVGDPRVQVLDVLAGALLGEMAAAANAARRGEVVVTRALADALSADWALVCGEERLVGDGDEATAVVVVQGVGRPVPEALWGPGTPLPDEVVRPWLLPAVFERLATGRGEFLTELRPAVALFLKFTGIDYDGGRAGGRTAPRLCLLDPERGLAVGRVFAPRVDGGQGELPLLHVRGAHRARGRCRAGVGGRVGVAHAPEPPRISSLPAHWHQSGHAAYRGLWRDHASYLRRFGRRDESLGAPHGACAGRRGAGQRNGARSERGSVHLGTGVAAEGEREEPAGAGLSAR